MNRTLLVAATLLAGPAAAQDFVQFQSPTGNIHCMIFSGPDAGARCDILEATRSFPAAPGWCDLDWGHAFEVSAFGVGAPICAGDTVADSRSAVLGYGGSVSLGGVICSSAETGVTCRNGAGHGFSLRRARQEVF